MRLQMTMKRPVVFPDIDPERFLLGSNKRSFPKTWKACGEDLLAGNESCMEMSESAGEIAEKIKGMHCGIDARRLGGGNYSISDGTNTLALIEEEDGTIAVDFGQGETLDVTDFGPGDVALFIRALMRCAGKLENTWNKTGTPAKQYELTKRIYASRRSSKCV